MKTTAKQRSEVSGVRKTCRLKSRAELKTVNEQQPG